MCCLAHCLLKLEHNGSEFWNETTVRKQIYNEPELLKMCYSITNGPKCLLGQVCLRKRGNKPQDKTIDLPCFVYG